MQRKPKRLLFGKHNPAATCWVGDDGQREVEVDFVFQCWTEIDKLIHWLQQAKLWVNESDHE